MEPIVVSYGADLDVQEHKVLNTKYFGDTPYSSAKRSTETGLPVA